MTVALIICKHRLQQARPNPNPLMVIRRQADKLAGPNAAAPDGGLGALLCLSDRLIFFLAGLINLLSRANFAGWRLKFSANKQTKLQKQLAKSWQGAGKDKKKEEMKKEKGKLLESLFASGVCRFNVA